ncbi:uncharacterized protein Dwil_GK17036 [Drosophila willistoni]|uniref:Nuclear speckle splicing regulatory protein 1 N-terminal domain-containing protein n=1 Tax=Drosophila willistoni TaxID=7260 RepID=B4NQ22_DROWI|nr:nuclear speckle splicing regulatory protein 1 [Drosophila willistoni]EDW86247.1 uncharacterized protein Dwil_GK17036 [Drosophila willistoni]
MSKQYGLIIPGQQKKKPIPLAKPTPASIFDESSDSTSEDDASAPKSMRHKTGVVSGPSVMERRKARNLQAKALAEDPTIFQYDELYDEMENKREEAKQTKSQEPRKPKYIGRLMEHAERRKLENELRIERQVQKEREAEGEKFKDKESYVTAAYRQKLESIRQLQEQEQRDEYLEAIGDVTKQKDLDGFYRHLYEQKLGPKTDPSSTEEVAAGYKPIIKQRTYRKRQNSEDEETTKTTKATNSPTKETSKDQTEGIKPPSSKAHLANNIDADSDFSIDDTSDEEDDKQKGEPKKEETKRHNKKENPKPKEREKKAEKTDIEPIKSSNEETTPPSQNVPLPSPRPPSPPVVDRSLIWRKRTVDEVFDAALARYQERKRLRQG